MKEKKSLKVKLDYSIDKNKPIIVTSPLNELMEKKIATNHIYFDSLKERSSMLYKEGYLIGGLNE